MSPPSAAYTRFFIAAILALIALGCESYGAAAVSNLSDFNNGDYPVNQSSPYAQGRAEPFTTGSDPTILVSATLAMDSFNATNNGGFTVSLFSNDSGLPGTSLLALSGPGTPQASGNYTYTAPSSFTLQPNTTYWIVAQVPLTGPDTYYNWTFTVNSAFTGLPGWSMGASASSVSFMGWAPSWGPQSMPLRMELDVTPAPEPGAATLLVIAGLVPVAARRRTRGR